VRHHPLEEISKDDVVVLQKNLSKRDVDELVSRISSHAGDTALDGYANEPSFLNDDEFRRYVSYLPSHHLNIPSRMNILMLQNSGIMKRPVPSNLRTLHLVLAKNSGGSVLRVTIIIGKQQSTREQLEIKQVVHSVPIEGSARQITYR
jgi:hypothetical protein